MNTLTLVMGRDALETEEHALSIGAPVLWPEVRDGRPEHIAVLLMRVDRWIARLAEQGVVVATHSPLVAHRVRRRVAEGVLPVDALRVLFVRGLSIETVTITRHGCTPDAPRGWLDDELSEMAAVMRGGVNQRRAAKAAEP